MELTVLPLNCILSQKKDNVIINSSVMLSSISSKCIYLLVFVTLRGLADAVIVCFFHLVVNVKVIPDVHL